MTTINVKFKDWFMQRQTADLEDASSVEFTDEWRSYLECAVSENDMVDSVLGIVNEYMQNPENIAKHIDDLTFVFKVEEREGDNLTLRLLVYSLDQQSLVNYDFRFVGPYDFLEMGNYIDKAFEEAFIALDNLTA